MGFNFEILTALPTYKVYLQGKVLKRENSEQKKNEQAYFNYLYSPIINIITYKNLKKKFECIF